MFFVDKQYNFVYYISIDILKKGCLKKEEENA